MSSFLVSNETIAEISKFIYVSYHMGYEVTGISIDQKERYMLQEVCKPYATEYIQREFDGITEETLFKALYQMNVEALKDRYKDNEWWNVEKIKTPSFPTWERAKYENGRFILPDSRYQLLKHIKCYLYQCNEGNIDKQPLFQVVKVIENNLMELIISNTKQYSVAIWA